MNYIMVGIKELRDRATKLLRSGNTLLIQRHGKDIGIYVPLEDIATIPPAIRLNLLHNIVTEIKSTLKQRNISEKEVLQKFEELRKARH